MATMTLSWKDLNLDEDGYNIYRSESPMDINNMPAPIATVGSNIGSYDDTTGIIGTTYYYRIGVIKGVDEKISKEFKVYYSNSTIGTHDIFNDSSAVLTYPLDGSVEDLGGLYDGSLSGTLSYTTGVINEGADLTGGDIIIGTPVNMQSMAISFWVYTSSSIGNFIEVPRFMIQSGNLFVWNTTSPTGSFTRYNGILSEIVLSEWNHVVINIRSDHSAVVYINDVDVTPAPSSGSASNTYPQNSIGDSFTGSIDHIRLFNRNITPSEVNQLYQEQNQG